MSLSIPHDSPFDLDNPSAVGALLSIDMLEPWSIAKTGVREALSDRILAASGAALASGDWVTAANEHWFKQDGGAGTILSNAAIRPIARYPLTFVARVYTASTTSSPLLAIMAPGDATHLIALDVSTTWRWIVRNAGGTINANEYLALAGPAPTVDEAYTTIFTIWGSAADHCKAWFQRDGQSATTHTAGDSFSVGFPAGLGDLVLGGTSASATMTGRIAALRAFAHIMTDELAATILADPVGWLRKPYTEQPWEMAQGVAIEQVPFGSAGIGQSVLVR